MIKFIFVPRYCQLNSLSFKFLSIGDDLGRLPITYAHLKVVELNQVSFEDMKEILVVLRLITNSPNLRELQISVSVIVLYFRWG